MKNSTLTLKGLVTLFLICSSLLHANPANDSLIFYFFQQTKIELNHAEHAHALKMNLLSKAMENANQHIFKAIGESERNINLLVKALQHKDQLRDQIAVAEKRI